MRRFVLATHGQMAKGMADTLEMIAGPQEKLIVITAYTAECQDPLPEFQRIIEQYPEDEIVIMTDLMGGSVNNNAMVLLSNPKIHVVTGVNLALVIGIVMGAEEMPASEVISNAIAEAREAIQYCNELSADTEDDDF